MFRRLSRRAGIRSQLPSKALLSRDHGGYLLPSVILLGLGFSVLVGTTFYALSQGSTSLSTQLYKQVAHEAALAGVNMAKKCLMDARFGESSVWPRKRATLTSSKCDGTDTQKVVSEVDTDRYYSTYSVRIDGDSVEPQAIAGVSGVSSYPIRSTGKVLTKLKSGVTVVLAEETINAAVQLSVDGSRSRNVKQLSINNNTTCVIATTRGNSTNENQWWPYCWGDNQYGQLGIGYFLDTPSSPFSGSTIPKAVSLKAKVQDAGSVQSHSVCYGLRIDSGLIGFLTGGKPACIGFRSKKIDYKVPPANGGKEATNALIKSDGTPRVVTKISVGVTHTCAIARDTYNNPASARAYCWGMNDYGQLGIDFGAHVIDMLSSYVDINSSKIQFLGNKYSKDRYDPMPLPEKVAEQVKSYKTSRLCTIPRNTSNPEAYCLQKHCQSTETCIYSEESKATGGVKGGAGARPDRATLYIFETINTALKEKIVVDISAGNGFTCAKYINPSDAAELNKITSLDDALNNAENVNGKIACWGRNDAYQLGINNKNTMPYPVDVNNNGLLGGKKVKSLATVKDDGVPGNLLTSYGATTMCAINVDDKVYCWGKNDVCQVGNNCAIGTTSGTYHTDFWGDLHKMSPGHGYSVACGIGAGPWIEYNYDVKTPVAIRSNETFRDVVVGPNWTTAINKTSNRVYFWGGVSSPTCGAANLNVRRYHINVPTLLTVKGEIGSKALTSFTSGMPPSSNTSPGQIKDLPFCAYIDNAVKCINHSLADQDETKSYSKTGVILIDIDTSMTGYSCAVTKDDNNHGSVACWGRNKKGNLGNRTFEDTELPILVDVYRGFKGPGSDDENSALGIEAKIVDKVVFF